MLHEYRCPVCGRVLHIRTYYDDIGRLEEVAVTCRCGYEWIKIVWPRIGAARGGTG